jgi:hypothetical protein
LWASLEPGRDAHSWARLKSSVDKSDVHCRQRSRSPWANETDYLRKYEAKNPHAVA